MSAVHAQGGAGAVGAASSTRQDQQRPDRVGALPRDVAREISGIYNAPATRRERGPFTLPVSDTVNGDLVVLDGNATINGVVVGQLVVINGDAKIENGAVVSGKLTITGGTIERLGRVDGDIRVWRTRFRYREVEGEIVPEPENEFAARWQRWRSPGDDVSTHSELFLSTSHTYSRVEGLPLYFGPRSRFRIRDVRVDAELYGIFRTGNRISWERENLGHRLRVEARPVKGGGVAVGARMYDEVDAIEKWQLSSQEVGLASFLFSRDYRDYWNRHGGSGYIRLFNENRSSATISYGKERWTSRNARDPWTLFNGNTAWRANPSVHEGVVNILTLSAAVDSRNDLDHPRSGWLASAEYERGVGNLVRTSPYSTPRADIQLQSDISHTSYGRLFLDIRRFNRLGQGAQLNLRAVVGGWLHGHPLPQQRRLSVSGVDALPGYDFRKLYGESYDAGTCVTASLPDYVLAGRPANCQRIALLQAEWKGDFRVSLFGDDDYGDARWFTSLFNADGTWVLFTNTGRGWSPRIRGSESPFDVGGIAPPLGTWRTDIGSGFDFGNVGVYVTKAVTHGGESANVFMRIGRRF